MRIAIIDDEEIIRERLFNIINQYYKGEVIIDEFNNGTHFLTDSHYFDIIFLDIEMNIDNGIDVGKAIRKNNLETIIIIVSGFKRYKQIAYFLHVFDFVVKPFSKEDIVKVLKEADRFIDYKRDTFIYFVADHQTFKIRYEKIIYLENNSRHVLLHTASQVYRHYGSLKAYESLLDDISFGMPHRSFLINMNKIKSLDKSSILMENDDLVPIARSRKKVFIEEFKRYLKN